MNHTVLAVVVYVLLWGSVAPRVTQDEADAIAEFFVAVRFRNATPVTGENACTEWPMHVVCKDDITNNTNAAVITELNFTSQSLSGSLPPSISRLSRLISFAVSFNGLEGTLPPEYRDWTSLQSFDVSRNQMSGTVPDNYSAWTQVTNVDFSHNPRMTGSFSPLFSAWTAVINFAATNCSFYGSLPAVWSAWGHVKKVDVNYNQLNGSLPPAYSNWTTIRSLEVRNNSLSGALPSSYAAWKGISFFYVGNNAITGQLPSAYSAWTLIDVFSTEYNSMSGTLPTEYSSWGPSITRIYAGFNQYTGSIPPSWGSTMTNMYTFIVSNNLLSGVIPSSLASWTKLSIFSASTNSVEGTLPEQLYRWGAAVTRVTLDENRLSGTIPTAWARAMTSLASLSLSSNSLSGTLPRVVGSSSGGTLFPALTFFSVSFNQINGTLPPPSSTWPVLRLLDVQNNTHLSGAMLLPSSGLGATVCQTELCSSITTTTAVLLSCFPRGFLAHLDTSDINVLYLASMAHGATLPSCLSTAAPASPATTTAPNKAVLPPSTLIIGAGVRSTSAAMVYATLLASSTSVGGRGAVPGLQRAVASLRLAARCKAAESSDNSSAMFGDLADSPLGVDVPVGAAELGAAGGAAVMNAVLVCALGGALHVLALVQRRVRERVRAGGAARPSTAVAVAASLLPGSLLPGALAVPFGTLLQPGVGACVALMASGARTAGSVACGAVMWCVWAVLPLYCVFAVVVRGRRVCGGVFALQSVSRPRVVVKERGRRRKELSARGRAVDAVAGACGYAMEATERWTLRSSADLSNRRPYRSRAQTADVTTYREHAAYLLENMEAVFGGYVGGREWYFAVDWGLAFVGGAVMGGAEAASAGGDACGAALWGTWSAAVLGAVQLGALVALRPNSVRLELWAGAVLGVLGLLSVVLSLAGAEDAADAVANVGAILEPIVVVVLLCGTAVSEALRAPDHNDVGRPSFSDASRRGVTDEERSANRAAMLLAAEAKIDGWVNEAEGLYRDTPITALGAGGGGGAHRQQARRAARGVFYSETSEDEQHHRVVKSLSSVDVTERLECLVMLSAASSRRN
jgi:hypothetical protein